MAPPIGGVIHFAGRKMHCCARLLGGDERRRALELF